jgi:hypothetical protein
MGMAVTSPWHSIKENVHHNNTDCNTGNNIETENRREGTGGKPLCKELARFSIRTTGPDAEMHVEMSPEFTVTFDHSSPARGAFVIEALAVMRRAIAEAVFPPLERFL